MIEGSELLYQRIADAMASAIPEAWSAARFDAFFFPGASVYEAEYNRESDGVARDFQPDGDGLRAFRELRRLFLSVGRPPWGRATFELRPAGTFNVQWGYDGCDANGDMQLDVDEEVRRREERRRRLTSG